MYYWKYFLVKYVRSNATPSLLRRLACRGSIQTLGVKDGLESQSKPLGATSVP